MLYLAGDLPLLHAADLARVRRRGAVARRRRGAGAGRRQQRAAGHARPRASRRCSATRAARRRTAPRLRQLAASPVASSTSPAWRSTSTPSRTPETRARRPRSPKQVLGRVADERCALPSPQAGSRESAPRGRARACRAPGRRLRPARRRPPRRWSPARTRWGRPRRPSRAAASSPLAPMAVPTMPSRQARPMVSAMITATRLPVRASSAARSACRRAVGVSRQQDDASGRGAFDLSMPALAQTNPCLVTTTNSGPRWRRTWSLSLQDQLDEPRVGVRARELHGPRGRRHGIEVDDVPLRLAHRLVRDHHDVVVAQRGKAVDDHAARSSPAAISAL